MEASFWESLHPITCIFLGVMLCLWLELCHHVNKGAPVDWSLTQGWIFPKKKRTAGNAAPVIYLSIYIFLLAGEEHSASFPEKCLKCSVLEMWFCSTIHATNWRPTSRSCLLQPKISFGMHCVWRCYLPNFLFLQALFTCSSFKLFFRNSVFSLYSASWASLVKWNSPK